MKNPLRAGRLFWGTFLIGLGAVMLFGRLGWVSLTMPALWKLWPLALVFWGAAVLTRGTRVAPVAGALAGVTLAVVLGGLISAVFGSESTAATSAGYSQDFTQPYAPGLHRASFKFESGAGSFTAEGSTDQLVSASVRSEFGHYALRSERVDRVEDVSLTMEGEKNAWAFSRSANRVALKFNADVVWDMRFSVGAAKMDLDLSGLNVERLTVESGASQVRIRLGDVADETRLTVTSGVSDVRVLVPRGSACEITSTSPLSRKSFKDFTQSPEGTYRTENYLSSQKKIYVTLESGLSQLRVVRY